MKHLNIKVYGRVQGVFFRVSAKEVADVLSIKGFIRNDPDGMVYIEAQGAEENLQKFLEWCKKGPNGALVERIASKESTVKDFADFTTL